MKCSRLSRKRVFDGLYQPRGVYGDGDECWTARQQMIDREQWARDAGVEIGRLEERAKAELEKQELLIETIKRFLDLGLSHEDVAHGAGVDISLVEEISVL